MTTAAIALIVFTAAASPPCRDVECVTPGEAAIGFYPLFNGRDYDGWHMDAADADAVSIRDGRFVFTKKCRLSTERDYENLMLRYEYRAYGGKSRVLVHAPENAESPPGLELTAAQLAPEGHWNTVEIIRCDITRVLLNGRELPATELGRPTARTEGRLVIDHSGGLVEYRNIRIRPLPGGHGWRTLFNGQSLAGWRTLDDGCWRIDKRTLTAIPAPKTVRLVSEPAFQDFRLRLSARYEGRGGAVAIRSRGKGRDPVRVRLGPDAAWIPGSLDKLAPASEPRMFEGCWAQVEIGAVGRNIQVLVNGKTVVDYLCRDRDWHPAGGIVLESTAYGKVEFRDVEIKTIE